MNNFDTAFNPLHNQKPIIAVQGLGFVGAAMAAALSTTKDTSGAPRYRVIGVDLPNEEGKGKITAANNGISPIRSSDTNMDAAYRDAKAQGNFIATSDASAFSEADIVIVDIPFDVKKSDSGYNAKLDPFLESMRALATQIKPDALIIVETTVPPGTTENYLHPLFIKALQKRGLDTSKFSLAHSYERVTPGANYLSSITQFYRVFAGVDDVASKRAKEFLESFINTKDYPLTQLHRPAASEMAKVMENSYRALNIAFLQEWTEFAEHMDVNLFGVLDAIRMRSTHKNIMSPGFGVGGYCLTKDALLADWSFHEASSKNLPLSCEGIRINDSMPKHSVTRLREYFGGSLAGKNIMLMGISYLNDVADTRYSPSEVFVQESESAGAKNIFHDPLVSFWPERKQKIETDLASITEKSSCDAVVLAVRHKDYLDMSAREWADAFPRAAVFLDANNILSEQKADELRTMGRDVLGIGKGHWQQTAKHNEGRAA